MTLDRSEFMKIHSISVDREYGSSYISMDKPRKGASAKQINLHDAIIIDLAKDGHVIGVEILDPEITEMLFGDESSVEAIHAVHIPLAIS